MRLLKNLLLGIAALLICSQYANAQTTLVATGSVWKYFDTGTDPNASGNWTEFFYDDSAWLSGPAELGFGDGDEATVVNGGPTNARTATIYFRQQFAIPAITINNAFVRVRRDDGVVVFIDGIEVFRSNVPEGQNNGTYTGTGTTSETTFFSTNIANLSWASEGDHIIAAEVHQQNATSSDLSFNLLLEVNVPPAPPVVSITTPTNGAVITSITVPIHATATDSDGTIVKVDFYEGLTLLGTDTTAPYSFGWTPVSAGSHTVYAVATDSQGVSTASSNVTFTVQAPAPALIQFGSTWKYLDTGVEPAAAWKTGTFDDSTWLSGPGQLGYGDDDEATVVSFGPETTNKFITTWFRKTFTVSNPANIANAVVRLLRDDGGVVYLNGTEIFRNNMPTGTVTGATLAVAAIDDAIVASPVNRTLFVSGANTLAVEIHQAGVGSSDISFDLELATNITIVPPTVTITAPTNGQVFLTPANVTVSATATDSDGVVTAVKFLSNGVEVGEDTTTPYSFTVNNVPVGNYSLVARAIDDSGGITDSAPVNISVLSSGTFLVSTGAVWRYLDNGTDQGTAWYGTGFDDSSWLSGPAEFGYGDGDEATTNSFGTEATNKFITTYYRHTFNLDSLAGISNLLVRIRRDDGAVVYLNGAEVVRDNMPAGAITYTTLASANTSSETTFFQHIVPVSALVVGQNTVAVEIHQNAADSSDISFDMFLVINVPSQPPAVNITAPANNAQLPQGNITFSANASDLDGMVTNVVFLANNVVVGQDATSPYSITWSNVAPGTYTLQVRGVDEKGNTGLSNTRTITVLAGTQLVLRQGLNGYTGTEDTDLRMLSPDTERGTNQIVLVDTLETGSGSAPVHGLLRFNDLVGSASNQIPAGATVTLATLSFRTANGSVGRVNVHQMIADWNESSTWNSMDTGISTNDVEARMAIDRSFTNNTVGNTVSLDMTSVVQAWVNGGVNRGWAFMPTDPDGYQFDSSEANTAANRPTLTVIYTAITGPALSIRLLDPTTGQVEITWPSTSLTLHGSDDLINWSPVAGNPSSPYVVTPGPNTKRFYDLR